MKKKRCGTFKEEMETVNPIMEKKIIATTLSSNRQQISNGSYNLTMKISAKVGLLNNKTGL
jgi:hypothetical protein